MRNSLKLNSDCFNFTQAEESVLLNFMDDGLSKLERKVRLDTRMFVKDSLPFKQNAKNYCTAELTQSGYDSNGKGVIDSKNSIEEYAIHLDGEVYCRVTSVVDGILPKDYFKHNMEDAIAAVGEFLTGDRLERSTSPMSKEDRVIFTLDKLRILISQLGTDMLYHVAISVVDLQDGVKSYRLHIGAKLPNNRLTTTITMTGTIKK
jgi:hypothetical protein